MANGSDDDRKPLDHTFDDKPPRRPKPPRKRTLRLPRHFRKSKPGSAAGIEPHELPPAPALTGATRITCIDYSADAVRGAGGRRTSTTSSPATGRSGRRCAGSTSTA